MQTRSTGGVKRSTSSLPNADSEPILEIETASANYCQVTGDCLGKEGKRKTPKGEYRKKAEIVPLRSNPSCERREDGCLQQKIYATTDCMVACCLCKDCNGSAEVTISAPF
jgi:hypothetical protein